jgi:LmbE family N-acetylglucosaminyl deacetylase
MRYDRCTVRLALLALLALAGALGLASAQTAPGAALPAPPITIDGSTRLLVVAPHPDDEALGAAGLSHRVRARHGAVRVVLLTSGDGFPEGVEVAERIAHPRASDYRGYGALRERESRTAMGLLGVPPGDVLFLGFPDEGLCRLASTYLFDKRRAFASPYTGRDSPPATEQMIRGSRYRGIDVRRELERLIEAFRPTVIALPYPGDEHPDHCSTHIFAREALQVVPSAIRSDVVVLHYLVHFGQWPLPVDGGATADLMPPGGFPPGGGHWSSLRLTPAETAAKRRALAAYSSQMHVIGRFIRAFGRSNELFVDGEPAAPPACWCDGENIAPETTAADHRHRP